MSHHHRREQRLARVITLIAASVLLAVAIPLFAMARLRLDVAESLGIVPNHAREELFSGGGLELIVLVEETPAEFSLPIRQYTAVYVAERTSDGVVMHDLGDGRSMLLPLQRYDRISAAADRSAIMLVDEQARPTQAVLVTIAGDEVRKLPTGVTDPGIPGDWTSDIFEGAAGCNAVSPDGNWVACAIGSPRIFGDWEVYIHPAGQSKEKIHLVRGLGSTPILGWAADLSALYLQNEKGIIKVPLDPDELQQVVAGGVRPASHVTLRGGNQPHASLAARRR